MALPGSAWKHVSSSGASTRLGARPARRARSWPPRRPSSDRGTPRRLKERASPRGSVACDRLAGRPRPDVLTRPLAGALIVGFPPDWGERSPTSLTDAALRVVRTRLATPLRGERGVSSPSSHLPIRHRMKRGYPLNLSISLSGGEETNQDAPSNGE